MTLPPLTLVLIAAAVALFISVAILPTAMTLLLWTQVAMQRLKTIVHYRLPTVYCKLQTVYYKTKARIYTVLAQRLNALNARTDSWADRSEAQLRAMQDDLSKEPFAQRTREQQLDHMDRHFTVYTAILAVKGVAALVLFGLASVVGVALAHAYDIVSIYLTFN